MDYRGPQAADFDNVRALNLAFLKLLAERRRAARLLARLPTTLTERCAALTPLQRERLAGVPFLLFSCREGDADYWDALFANGGARTLFDGEAPFDAAVAGVVSAALGFIWQLARQNPYAARVVCGASLHWCEQLAERPLLDVVTVAASGNVLTLRAPDDTALWTKLLHPATSGERAIREAAQISALQRLLTRGSATPAGVALAARTMARPTLQVADEIER